MAQSPQALAGATPPPLGQDARTIGLVGLAHGSSHFFHLLLPPLFPALIAEFGFSYSQLGLLVTVFFIISGVGQALSGFLVDKVGARPVLFAALSAFVAAGLCAATATGYGGLLAAAALAGLGNAPFHPVDFTILNKRVSQKRLGHAFSVHGISGNLGWALAPVFHLGLLAWGGDWRTGPAGAALLAAAVLAIMVWQRAALDDRAGATVAAKAAGLPEEHPMAFLKLPSVWLCFSFFFWTTAALSAVQSFASPALQQLYGLPLAATAYVVSGYMLCGALGMVAGGFLAARAARLEKVIGGSMLLSAALLALPGTGWLPGGLGAVLVALAGVGTGLAGPSRDMLIKRAAPPGATGRVYGTVYSGLDTGFALAAPVFGWLLDHGHPAGVFWGAALAMLLGVVSATVVGAGVARRAALKPGAAVAA
ncbi:MFS transporter [Ideonella livida]|uniref:MFS transporter n=1 Tax=Ideonella livida TaxID=2707176 RepID=A0A7C9THZ8_9BURK|nr:MFS transporter [Ideonella livida]NDY90002.1 MFS transporter [Ideonella livida]